MQAGNVRFQVGVHLDLVGIELQLRAVQQGFRCGKAGGNMVHHLDELNNAHHGAVRHGGGNVARNGIFQGRAHIGMCQLLGPSALAVQNITVALYQNVPGTQHVGQFANLLGIGNGLVERLGKVVADQNGQVGVAGFQILVAVTVDDRQVIVIVFLRDKAAGVLAEGADLVLPRVGVTDQLAFVQNLVDGLHDLVAALHTHTNINGAGLVGNVVLGAQLFQPICTAAAGGNHNLVGAQLAALTLFGDHNALALAAFQQNVVTFGVEQHLHTAGQQIVLDVQVQLLGFFGSKVADGAVHQLQASLDGALADLLDLAALVNTFHMRVSAKFQIDLVSVVDQLLGKILTDQLRQLAANLIGEGQLAVRERTGTGKAGGDGAGGFAVHAVAGFIFGAVALFYRFALFNQADARAGSFAAFAQQFQCGKNTGRAGANDNQIIIVHVG